MTSDFSTTPFASKHHCQSPSPLCVLLLHNHIIILRPYFAHQNAAKKEKEMVKIVIRNQMTAERQKVQRKVSVIKKKVVRSAKTWYKCYDKQKMTIERQKAPSFSSNSKPFLHRNKKNSPQRATILFCVGRIWN